VNYSRVIRCGLVVTAVIGVAGVVDSTTVFPLAFEEAVTGADAVVLGTVTAVPELGILDPGIGDVVRRNAVRVDRYLKGQGAKQVTVITLGGQFIAQTESGPKRMSATAEGMPQLPPEGTDVLLFLRKGSEADTYLVYSASHGVVRVEEKGSPKERVVSLRFGRPEVMPEELRHTYEAEKAKGINVEAKPLSGDVPVSALESLVERILE
jgi:hypothetical protein